MYHVFSEKKKKKERQKQRSCTLSVPGAMECKGKKVRVSRMMVVFLLWKLFKTSFLTETSFLIYSPLQSRTLLPGPNMAVSRHNKRIFHTFRPFCCVLSPKPTCMRACVCVQFLQDASPRLVRAKIFRAYIAEYEARERGGGKNGWQAGPFSSPGNEMKCVTTTPPRAPRS